MNRRRDPFRTGTSVGVALLTLGVSVAAPLLERGAVVGERAIESHHDAARCVHAHDHRVCTQVGANLALAAGESHQRLALVVVRAVPAAEVEAPGSSALAGPPSRAPPLT